MCPVAALGRGSLRVPLRFCVHEARRAMTSLETPGCPTYPWAKPSSGAVLPVSSFWVTSIKYLSPVPVALALVVSRLWCSPARDSCFCQAKSVRALHLNAKR